MYKIMFVFTLFQLLNSNKSLKLMIDHDGGADDAMAIFQALLHEKQYGEPNVIGLTTVSGNVNESQVFVNSQRILNIAGRRDVPIYRGSTRSLVTTVESDGFFGKDGLGDNKNICYKEIKEQNESAAEALIEMSKQFPGELLVMSIGPLTNIALAIRLDTGFIERLAQLYVGAGTIYSEEDNNPEFNSYMDVEAHHILAEAARKDRVTVIPFSQIKRSLNNTLALKVLMNVKTTTGSENYPVIEKNWQLFFLGTYLNKKWRTEVLGSIPSKIMRAQNSFERISQSKTKSWHLLDPAVTAIVLDKSVVNEVRNSKNGIILCGNKRGINTNNFETNQANVKLIYSANIENYNNFLMNIFLNDAKYTV